MAAKQKLAHEPNAAQAWPSEDRPVERQSDSPLEGLITETINTLMAQGISQRDMGALLHLKDAVQYIVGEDGGAVFSSRRKRKPASDRLMARACVIMDLLIQGGWSQEQAAQTTARQLIATGVALPDSGGDARGWKRMMNWRFRLQHGAQSDEARDEYLSFKQEIAAIPPRERLAKALNDRIWDKRRIQEQ